MQSKKIGKLRIQRWEKDGSIEGVGFGGFEFVERQTMVAVEARDSEERGEGRETWLFDSSSLV